MTFIKTLLGAFSNFFSWLGDKQLLDAGEAKANAKHNKKAVEDVEKSNQAVSGLNDPIERKRVRDRFSRD